MYIPTPDEKAYFKSFIKTLNSAFLSKIYCVFWMVSRTCSNASQWPFIFCQTSKVSMAIEKLDVEWIELLMFSWTFLSNLFSSGGFLREDSRVHLLLDPVSSKPPEHLALTKLACINNNPFLFNNCLANT